MATNNSSNQKFTNNADGWDLSGGTIGRKLTATGGDITLTGSGAAVITFPTSTSTLATLALAETLENKTKIVVGAAASATTRLFYVTGDVSGGTTTLERTNAATTGALGTVIIKGTSTGDMANGFGAAFQFAIQDNAGVENLIANIQGLRANGADTSGELNFTTTNAGSPVVAMNIAYNQVIRLGVGSIQPITTDGAALGTSSVQWSDLFMASGAVINIANGNWVATHTSAILTVGTGDLRVTSAGTNTASVATLGGTQTFTAKTMIATTNVVEEISTTASSATPTPTGGSLRNFFTVTALAAGATFAAPSGTPANANRLMVRIKDNGTARTLAWNAIYRASSDLALPTTTIISKTLYLGFVYNSTDSKWDLLALLGNF